MTDMDAIDLALSVDLTRSFVARDQIAVLIRQAYEKGRQAGLKEAADLSEVWDEWPEQHRSVPVKIAWAIRALKDKP